MSVWSHRVSELRPPTGLLFIPHVIEYGDPRWKDTDRGKQELRAELVPVAFCPPQIPHGLARALNRGLCGKRTATNCLSYGTTACSLPIRIFNLCGNYLFIIEKYASLREYRYWSRRIRDKMTSLRSDVLQRTQSFKKRREVLGQ
jgi:hypothetical protein